MENAWRRGHGKDDSNFRVEGVDFDASGSPCVASSGFRPGDIAFRSGVNDKWTAIDYTCATARPTGSAEFVADPFAGARQAIAAKMRQPAHQSLRGNPHVDALVLAQGSMGGFDRSSYGVLRKFAAAVHERRVMTKCNQHARWLRDYRLRVS